MPGSLPTATGAGTEVAARRAGVPPVELEEVQVKASGAKRPTLRRITGPWGGVQWQAVCTSCEWCRVSVTRDGAALLLGEHRRREHAETV